MYKLILSDMDETLLNDDHKISEGNRTAILRAREQGVRFVPATGRPFSSLDYELKTLGLFGKKDEYVISLNGNVITENAHNKPFTMTPIKSEVANFLYRYATENNLAVHTYTVDSVYVKNLYDSERAYISGRMPIYENDSETLDFLQGEPICKMLYSNTNMEELYALARTIADKTQELEIVYSANRYIEFNPKGISKGEGLKHLAEHLGIGIEETIAVGDSSNDLAMIEAAGLGIAVSNATDEVKAAAAYITHADNNHDAIAEVIKKFCL